LKVSETGNGVEMLGHGGCIKNNRLVGFPKRSLQDYQPLKESYPQSLMQPLRYNVSIGNFCPSITKDITKTCGIRISKATGLVSTAVPEVVKVPFEELVYFNFIPTSLQMPARSKYTAI
jgi:hypothetical protein